MPRRIVYPNYFEGALVDLPIENVRHHLPTGDWYAEFEGKVYNCHPKDADGAFPIRFQIKPMDVPIYPEVREMFPHIFQ